MAADVQTISELDSKIAGLMLWAREEGFSELSSVRALARASDISYGTLQSSMRSRRISVLNQGALAKAFGFDLEWREWRDSAKVFLSKFRSHRSRASALTVEATLTQGHLDRRLADFAFGVAGSFDPRCETDGIRLVLSLSFDPRGWPVLPDLTVGLRQIDLQLSCARDSGEFELFPLHCKDDQEGNFVSDGMGTGKGYAYWTINAPASGFMIGTRRRNDGRDCICKGLSDGDEIKAVMSVRKIQCFGTVSGKPLETNTLIKRRFVEQLAKVTVLNGSEAILGEQILKVVHKP